MMCSGSHEENTERCVAGLGPYQIHGVVFKTAMTYKMKSNLNETLILSGKFHYTVS